MKPPRANPRSLGIALRTALWSWAVTLVTLGVFAAVIIPQQKRFFVQNLESKAHGVTVSLRDVAAGSVVNEDFSSVVDHCKEMLRGDPALDYVVITKNDGFSLINERSGWRSVLDAGPEWRPATRQTTSGIGTIPLFSRRVFHYSQPFDYSGIEWGWIHVGLDLESYDRSVISVYQRTFALAVGCILFSLMASAFYARRLVRPILSLRNVVQRVAGGDLAVRAEIDRSDEIGTLAGSVNTMTKALLRRDHILESVRFAAQQFLVVSDWNIVIQSVLSKIGSAAEASRAYVFENQHGEAGQLLAYQRYEWADDGIEPQVDSAALKGCDYAAQGFGRWVEFLQRGEIVCGNVSDLPPPERPLLESQNIRSIISIPIRVEGVWWGFLGLDECRHDRVWTEAEQDSLRAAADMLGATIARQAAQHALIEAKEHLEQRVRERTLELQEQVFAKQKAHTELAEAQARLMEASRAAGKAEVATSVLHNVGNVLNSVSVSATLVGDRLRQSKLANLRRATAMLRDQNGSIAEFLTTDPKGKVLPEYLGTISEQLAAEQTEMLDEVVSLGHNIEHIKKIVAMQQSYAKVSGALEEVQPTELVEDALRMNAATFESHHVTVLREYDSLLPRVNVDRHKVLQVLINLVRNAKHALDAGSGAAKRLVVSVRCAGPERVVIRVRDNGVGIAPENLARIFQHGFTTKKDGHGFGLHSGANAAREMGGRLVAHSDGPGKGAEFTLELPVNRHQQAALS